MVRPFWFARTEIFQNKRNVSRGTVFIRLSALGAYLIFGPSGWALIRGGRLFEAGRLLNFHHFQQGKGLFCNKTINKNKT